MSYVPENGEILLRRLDFTAQASQSFRPNGTYSFAGLSWTSENQASSTTWENRAGTGLALDIPAGPSFFGDNTRTAPLMRCNAPDVLGTISFARIRALRWRARILTNASEDAEFVKVGFEWATTPAQYNFLPGRGWPTGVGEPEAIGVQSQLSAQAASGRDNTPITSDDVIEATWKCGEWIMDLRSGTWSGEFPASSTFRSSLMAAVGSNVVQSGSTGGLRFVITAQPTGSATSFQATVTHIEISEVLI